MGISHYIKEIGRGKDGARALAREQAADLMGQVLDGAVTDLEMGAFCIAMRIKGETDQEMAGFLDATHERLNRLPDNGRTTVVLPSYNGARKLPVLTPLLAMLLARQGAAVVVHGTPTEDRRVTSEAVFAALGEQQGQQGGEHWQLARTVVAGQHHGGQAVVGQAIQALVCGVQKARHFFRRFALDAHGQAEATDLQVGHGAVKHLAHQVGGLFACERACPVLAATDFLDVLTDAHGARLSGSSDDFGLYAE